MPSYPTRSKRADPKGFRRPASPGRSDIPKTRPSRPRPGVGPKPKPTRTPPIRPGRGPKHVPFRPLPYRFPFPTRPPIPWGPLLGGAMAAGYLLNKLRPEDPPEVPPGRDYRLVHGPNYYGGEYESPPTQWFGAHVNFNSGTGPMTGLISNQARSGGPWYSFSQWVAAHTSGFDPGFWIPRADNARWASHLAFVSVRPTSLAQNPRIAFLPPMRNAWVRTLPNPAPSPKPYQPPPWARPYPHPAPITIPPPYRGWPDELPAARPPIPQPAPRPGVAVPIGQPPPRLQPIIRIEPGRPPTVIPPEFWYDLGMTPEPLEELKRRRLPRVPVMHEAKPPGPKLHERKGSVQKAAWKIAAMAGELTEVGDLISVAHKSLPKSKQARSFYKGKPIHPSKYKQMKAVYQHYQSINLSKFLVFFIENQIEDAAIGRLSSQLDKAAGPKVGVSRTGRVLDLGWISDVTGAGSDFVLSKL